MCRLWLREGHPYAGPLGDAEGYHAGVHGFAQSGQDRFIHSQFFASSGSDADAGRTFVDIGAHDGVTDSNTFFFERCLGWRGACLEPQPAQFARMQAQRRCLPLRACAADVSGPAAFTIAGSGFLSGMDRTFSDAHRTKLEREWLSHINVTCFAAQAVVDFLGYETIDYLSVDVEGAELTVLKAIDFARTRVRVITAENNEYDTAVRDFLASKGFDFARRVGVDDVYVNAAAFRSDATPTTAPGSPS